MASMTLGQEPGSTSAKSAIASPFRRVAAWLLDYLLIAAYLILLTAASLAMLASPVRGAFTAALSAPLDAELFGFALLTAPVVLYFALLEASSWRATIGKRALGLKVASLDGGRLPLGRALVREGVRFLPWEMSHALVWQVALSPGGRTFPPWMAAGFGLVYLLVFSYLVTLFVGSTHRTIYDRLAGSVVLRS
jgi:uncharacterized RDD family membrane protein YckC